MKIPIFELVVSMILLASFIIIVVKKEYREAVAIWLAGIMEDKESDIKGKSKKAANKRFIVFWAVCMVTILTINYLAHPDKFAWEMWASFFGAVLVGSGITTYEKIKMKKLDNGKIKDPE